MGCAYIKPISNIDEIMPYTKSIATSTPSNKNNRALFKAIYPYEDTTDNISDNKTSDSQLSIVSIPVKTTNMKKAKERLKKLYGF